MNSIELFPMKWLLELEPDGLAEKFKQSLEPVLIDDILWEIFRNKGIFVEKC